MCLDGVNGVQLPSVYLGNSVYKCCGNSAVYNEHTDSCVNSRRSWPLPVPFTSGFPPTCPEPGNFVIAGNLDKTHTLNGYGSVTGPAGDIPSSQFCLELLEDQDDDFVAILTCPTPNNRLHKWRTHQDFRFTLYPMGLFLSVFFLAVTLIASCLLPSTYHVLHWRCQTNHVACLLLGDLILAIVQLSVNALPPSACVAMGKCKFLYFSLIISIYIKFIANRNSVCSMHLFS